MQARDRGEGKELSGQHAGEGCMQRLLRGDLLPKMVTPPPGPRARHLSRDLERQEAPGINTLFQGSPSLLWQEACGANVLDVDGNLYVDLTSGFGVAAVGHRHPEVVRAVRAQSEELLHGMGDVWAHPRRLELARRLVELAPVDDGRVYFAVSGADAVEIALKTALLATGRPEILAFQPAYHGLTLGALAVTSRDEFRRPFTAHLSPRVSRLDYGCAVAEIEAVVAGASVAALIVEPIAGREGVLVPPVGWLGEIATICRRHKVALIADEIFTGFGRTGSWFAVDADALRPDLLCCGKALGGGLPLAAVVGRHDLMAAWDTPGEALHTATFVAHPLACAAALAALEILERQRLPERAGRLGATIQDRLESWPRQHPAIQEIRGRGMLWGVELSSASLARNWAAAALQRGVLVLAGGAEGRVIQIVPPLTIDERQLDVALDLMEQSLLSL